MFKIMVIAWQSLRSFARDRVFHSALVFSLLFVLFAFFLSMLTVLESRKILLDFGLSAISILGVLLALFLGVMVVGREMATRTIYTILSKPVSRSEYILGKFLGAAAAMAIVHVLNALTLAAILWQVGEGFPAGFVHANYLMVLESVLLMSLAMLFSLCFSSLILAASLSGAVFILGRSSFGFHLLQERSTSAIAKGIARVLFDLLPSLERLNVREVVAYGKAYPEGMVMTSSLYFVAYLAVLLSFSIWAIHRKDFV